jgi:hypothetical protein
VSIQNSLKSKYSHTLYRCMWVKHIDKIISINGSNEQKKERKRARNSPKQRSVKEDTNIGCNNLLGTKGSVKRIF